MISSENFFKQRRPTRRNEVRQNFKRNTQPNYHYGYDNSMRYDYPAENMTLYIQTASQNEDLISRGSSEQLYEEFNGYMNFDTSPPSSSHRLSPPGTRSSTISMPMQIGQSRIPNRKSMPAPQPSPKLFSQQQFADQKANKRPYALSSSNKFLSKLLSAQRYNPYLACRLRINQISEIWIR
jgi:hypothetical protein